MSLFKKTAAAILRCLPQPQVIYSDVLRRKDGATKMIVERHFRASKISRNKYRLEYYDDFLSNRPSYKEADEKIFTLKDVLLRILREEHQAQMQGCQPLLEQRSYAENAKNIAEKLGIQNPYDDIATYRSPDITKLLHDLRRSATRRPTVN